MCFLIGMYGGYLGLTRFGLGKVEIFPFFDRQGGV